MSAGAAGWMSIADVLGRLSPPLSDSELSEIAQLASAIGFSLQCARHMPTTLDARARALVVTKLQEAEHWTLEIVRAAKAERD